MNNQEYQQAIPHFCRHHTTQQHVDHLLGCWSITSGFVQKSFSRGSEGPAFCHDCDESIRAKRWVKVWYKKFFVNGREGKNDDI